MINDYKRVFWDYPRPNNTKGGPSILQVQRCSFLLALIICIQWKEPFIFSIVLSRHCNVTRLWDASLWWSYPFLPTTWSSHSLRRPSGFKDLEISTLTLGIHVENHPLHVMPFIWWFPPHVCVVLSFIPICLGSYTCMASCPHVPLKYLLISRVEFFASYLLD